MATLRVTNLRGRSANVAPNLPDGANITGVVTATSFVGSGANLTGIDATSIKDSGDTVSVQANTSGIEVTGVSTYSGDINASAGIDVDGHTELDDLNVTGVSTFATHSVYADGARAKFGDSSDIQVYHDSGSNYIKLGVVASTLNIEGTAETLATFTDDGSCALKHNNATKIETSATGITVSGTVAATSYTGDGSALTGIEAGITTTYQYAQSGIITINLSGGQAHELTLAAGVSTITCTGGTGKGGESQTIIITQPSSGITTVGFSSYFLWPSGSPPDLSRTSASSEIDLISFVIKQETLTGTGVTQLLASAGVDYQ